MREAPATAPPVGLAYTALAELSLVLGGNSLHGRGLWQRDASSGRGVTRTLPANHLRFKAAASVSHALLHRQHPEPGHAAPDHTDSTYQRELQALVLSLEPG